MKYINNKFFKRHFLFLILTLFVFISQNYLFKSHLNLGFDFTVDEYITQFRQLENSSDNLAEFVVKTFKKLRLPWLHEYYYVGILHHLLNDNFVAYHQVAIFFKSLATLSTYPLFFVLTGSTLIAFVSSLIFAISYTAAGSLEPVVVNGDYLGIIALSLFLAIYFYLVKKKSSSSIFIYLLGLILLISSLSIATTRTFPTVLIMLFTEIFMVLKNRLQDSRLIIKRVIFFLLPVILVPIFIPQLVINQVKGLYPWAEKYYITERMYELLLIPFLSFASTIVPVRFWSTSTIIPLFLLTIILGLLLSKKPLRFIVIALVIWALGFLITNWLWSTSSTHYLPDVKSKSPIAFYILGLALSFLFEWLQTKNKLLIGLFFGPFVSFIFIFCIWLGTYEKLLIFTNIHRYLTHSAIFISFFIGSLIVLLYRRFAENRYLKVFAFLPFLIIPIYFFISLDQINNFYDERFAYGFTLRNQDYLRRQLVPYLQDLEGPGLIYIDTGSDKLYSYFYEQIYTFGPLYWLHWYDQSLYKIDFDKSHVTIPHSILDYEMLESGITMREGVKGIVFHEMFFKPSAFTAVKIIKGQVINIKEVVIKDLKLSQ